jgi:hypothetical protein
MDRETLQKVFDKVLDDLDAQIAVTQALTSSPLDPEKAQKAIEAMRKAGDS